MARKTNTAAKVDAAAVAQTAVSTTNVEQTQLGANATEAGKKLIPIDQVDLSGCTNHSQKMRQLHVLGYATADIARHLGKKYQHVRNVLIQPAPKAKVDAAEPADTETA